MNYFKKRQTSGRKDKKDTKKSGARLLTILECLDDFRIARLTLDRPIKWRNEKFIFGKLVKVGDVVDLAVGLHHRHAAELLRIAAEVAVANVKALEEETADETLESNCSRRLQESIKLFR